VQVTLYEDKCTGCGKCVDVCSPDALRMDDKIEKAVVKYPDDCIGCFECELNCPSEAIYVHPLRS
jgi:NAD-dependent dihydropyrimidine dehydrogenase PreA subunit